MKSLVAVGLICHRDDRFTDKREVLSVQNVGHHVGIKSLQILCRLEASETLEIAFFQLPFQGVDAGNAQYGSPFGVLQCSDD